MDEDELWLTEEEAGDDDYNDPSSFTMALTYQGPPGEFRTRNRPGERQRPHVSAFRAGPRKKPAFTVSCNAKAMIHGDMGGSSSKAATLLVYEFKFRSYRGARLKYADITFEFKPLPGQEGRISVAKVSPDGIYKMQRTEQIEDHGVRAGVNGALMQAVGVEVGAEYSTEKVANYHTVVTGDRPQDDWGDYYEARFTLSENKSQEDGIPAVLTACILLERDDDQDFVCVPRIHVKPNFFTTVATLFSARDPDDPVYFSVEEPPLDLLEGRMDIDRDNLGSTNLKWECTIKKTLAEVVELLDSGKIDWDSLDQVDKDVLAKPDPKNKARPTWLHRMAQNWAGDEFRQLRREEREKIVLFLLDKAIPHVDHAEDPILAVAMVYYTTDFIDFIIAHRPDMVRHLLLSTDVKGMNCLHKAFKETFITALKDLTRKPDNLAKTISSIAKLLEYADVGTVTAKDENGNTPIHYSMDFRLCHIPGHFRYDGQEYRYEDIIRTLLAKATPAMKRPEVLFNKKHLSPYGYYGWVEAGVQNQQRVREAQRLSGNEAKSKENQNKDDRRDLKKSSGKQASRELYGRKSAATKEESLQPATSTRENAIGAWAAEKSGRYLPHHSGISVTPANGENDQSLSGTESGPPVRRSTGNLSTANDTAHHKAGPESSRRARTPKPDGPKTGTGPRTAPWLLEEGKEAADSILGFLKCFLIRNSSDRDAKDLLYGRVASDKNLFFDASHLRFRKVEDVVNLISKVSKAGGFEDTLSYVKIPQLGSEVQSRAQRQNMANERRPKRNTFDKEPSGRSTLIKVFDKLVEVKVRRILRLQVEDNVDEWAHTDTAIEQSIKGYNQFAGGIARNVALEIEECSQMDRRDWCKPDMNLDVIKYAAPSVEHIHLHWSGNQTVLYGWASGENGIPQMYRGKRSLLSKITLHAYRQDSLLGEKSETPRTDAWIESMERFRKAMIGLHRSSPLSETRRVKVALIDDGIDLDNINDYEIAHYTGVSYCSGDGRDEDAWWKSTSGHGTVMANMISRINPWVTLDVIKIHSGPSYIHGEGARSISPRSAADAINAAVIHDADVISISWTITDLEYRMSRISDTSPDADGNKTRAEESDMQLLRAAISNAVKDDRRLILCAAADDIRIAPDSTLPYSHASSQILRIGVAGRSANRDPGSGSANSITYFLPGDKIAEDQRYHSAKKIVYHNGSSVSTALAAGLASLIMYCCYFLHANGSDHRFHDRARALRDHANMRKVFNSINRYLDWSDDSKIIPVWGLFGDKTSQLEKAVNREDKIKVLEDLVIYLCGDVNERKQSLT
ncbi:hypothetical protein BDV18DRAFT_151634 [Aspergillus unguis]